MTDQDKAREIPPRPGDYRDVFERAYLDTQKVLDEFLGTEEIDGSEGGLAADVWMLGGRVASRTVTCGPWIAAPGAGEPGQDSAIVSRSDLSSVLAAAYGLTGDAGAFNRLAEACGLVTP